MKVASSLAAFGVMLTTAGLAGAQPPETSPPTPTGGEQAPAKRPLGAPTSALELSVATAYTQGFGSLKSGVGMPTVADAGIGFDLGIGYRIDPHWGVLWNGQYQEFAADRTAHARGITNTLAAQYHVNPMHRLDPWVEGGVGYRVLWEIPAAAPNLISHGFQVARVRAGLDLRADANVAFGPVIGADATVFLFQDVPNLGTSIAGPRLSSFVYAGIQGRFDAGGNTVSGPRAVANR